MARRTRIVVAGVLATAVGMAAAGMGVADAATAPPPLAVTMATPNVVAERYVYDDEAYLNFDLGVYVIAGKNPLEIRAKRSSYSKPITAEQIVVKNGKKKAVKLPAGMVTGWGGLKKFTTITLKDAAGKQVASYQTDFCPNSYDSARTRRDAPAQTPYPRGCSDAPFNLGAVWGVQAGWNASVSSYPQTESFDLADGAYTATVTVNKKYRDYFKIPSKSSTLKLNVKVVTIDRGSSGPGGGDGATAAAVASIKAARAGDNPASAAALAEHGEHAGQGDEGRQLSAYDPKFRPAAKRPRAVKASAIAKGPRPDLRSLPAWGISLSQEDNKTYVGFGATVWNGGTSPLLVDGFRRTGTERMDAYQYFFDAKGKQVGSVAAGSMQWDAREGHLHWHFTDFAQYSLLKADKKVAVRSGKEAFCLANTDAVDYTLKNAKWRPDNTDLSSSCGQNTSVAVREVLDVGNGDTYTQDRPGQAFDVTGLPNGTYYIQVKANPANKLTELSTKNNTALRKIILGGTATARTLKVPSVNGLD